MLRLPFFLSWLLLPALFFQACCSIVIPPVTLTGNKTAIEKQIIGEQNQLEKDIWLMASARTTSRADLEVGAADRKQLQKENNLTYQGLLLLDVFGPRLVELKADQVVGEGRDGLLVNLLPVASLELPAASLKKYDPALAEEDEEGRPYRTLLETVKEINRARSFLVRGYIENQKRKYPDFNASEKDILKAQAEISRQNAQPGEYLQNEDGSWQKK